MLVITGGFGFIGSCLVTRLTNRKVPCLVIDEPTFAGSWKNSWQWSAARISPFRDGEHLLIPEQILAMEGLQGSEISGVIHLGAISDKAEANAQRLLAYNTQTTQRWWDFCRDLGIPFLYASSAATYGAGENGFDDRTPAEQFFPNDPYGHSKLLFDRWALTQIQAPPQWWGVRFFNVYGPNEYHKGFMASPVFHGFHSILQNGTMKLFRSGRSDIPDGHQKRDFIYIDDALNMLEFLWDKRPANGIYNLGTGQAQTYASLAEAVFKAVGKQPKIEWVETPAVIQEGYQYFTQAVVDKITQAGFNRGVPSLEDRVHEYVRYLNQGAGKPKSFYRSSF